jgi:hypothetical protein
MKLEDTGPGGTTSNKRIGLQRFKIMLLKMEYHDFATSIFRVKEHDVRSRFP